MARRPEVFVRPMPMEEGRRLQRQGQGQGKGKGKITRRRCLAVLVG